uniref:Uncharacterized protein n=1 Tax=Caenorhabditis tropicalis TaxID=1561998 RepID=A0A1I7TYX6_9PELO
MSILLIQNNVRIISSTSDESALSTSEQDTQKFITNSTSSAPIPTSSFDSNQQRLEQTLTTNSHVNARLESMEGHSSFASYHRSHPQHSQQQHQSHPLQDTQPHHHDFRESATARHHPYYLQQPDHHGSPNSSSNNIGERTMAQNMD